MATRRASNYDSRLKHRPLNTFRFIRGVICLLVFLSTAFICLVYLAPLSVVVFPLASKRISRKAVSFFFGIWLSMWPSLFEKINKTKIVFSGDSIPKNERVLVIANHRTEVDWMFLWDLALRKGRIGCIKYILKRSLMKLPVFGWGFHILEFIPVQRKWEMDEQILYHKLSTFKDPQDPLWLALFPEGTDYTEEKSEASKKFAAKVGLPMLTNVLLPKTKGFNACLLALRGSIDAVYDVTIGYKNHQCPSFMDIVFGVDPSEVHLHVQRIPMEEIPVSETQVSSWLVDTFQMKDQLLSGFNVQGHFPNQVEEKELSTLKCLFTFTMVVSFTAVFVYLTLFSLIWFKLYVGLSCAYLAIATRYNFQLMPLTYYVKALYSSIKNKIE
ncbi:hypothetical protein TanjilG_14689 [Lupinus angustifolius]|uniref:1-acylglycerol-3-phosphate O-acyltransferase n=1 Tax=Lupinus angustifolius TaxID=3871 RepID=A0A1J7GSE7_LUPAN|nr:PREDICTED: probable 1-acyl-sn-glycerol-3-phosphate acyltransferase 4 [Lupinus angustifolius]OIW03464.1 hypothetical protein TanjilG_14689 [Lupinus angustifolius]